MKRKEGWETILPVRDPSKITIGDVYSKLQRLESMLSRIEKKLKSMK